MRNILIPFLAVTLIVSMFLTPAQTAYAQGIELRATVNKNFSDLTIPAGGTSILTIFFFNPNEFDLINASLRDNMPTGLRVVSVTGNTCSGTVTAAPGSSTVELNGGTIPRQAGSTPGSCIVTVNVTAPNPGTFTNRIPTGTLTSSAPDGRNVTNLSPASATLQVNEAGQPTVSKSFSPTSIWAGGTSQLSIVITNNASGTLTGATIYDDLPTGVTLAIPPSPTLSGCGGSASVDAAGGGTRVTLNNGTIAPASSCTITVDVTGNVQGNYPNRIPAGRLGNNQNLSNATDATARLAIREVGLAKRFSPPTFSAGGTTTLIITLQNPKSTPYTGVTFTDTLPVPMTAVSVAGNTCNGSVGITPATAVTLSGGTIPQGSPTTPGTCTISVVVTVPAGTTSGQLRNSIPVNQFTTAQGIGILASANANVTVSGTEVSGIKSFSPSTITAGANSRLRIDFFAPSDTSLTSFRVQDDLPAGVTISNPSNATFSGCGAAALNATPGGNVIVLENGTVAAGQRCRIDVNVTSSTLTQPGSPHTNTIPPQNITNAEGRAPANALTAGLAVTGGTNLAIALNKRFDPPGVFLGAASTMSIRLTNPGNITLTGISFEDRMPSGMILADPVSFDVGSCGGTLTGSPGDGSFTFSGGTLLPQSACTLTLRATMSINGNLTNVIPAGSVGTNENVTNNADVEATLSNLPGATVSKSFAPNPISANAVSLLTITVFNTGNIGLTQMRVSDSLPAGLTIAGAPAPVNNCGGTLTAVAGTQLIELLNGVLAGNASCTMVVSITGANPGDYVNTIPAGGLVADPNTRNPLPATDTLTITGDAVQPTPPPTGGNGGGGGRGRTNNNSATSAANNTFQIPVTGFAPGKVTKLETPAAPAYDATSLTVEIPVLKVKTPIVGIESKKGKWDVSWLQDQVGWLDGSAYPTWKGNSLLTGHVVNADGKPGIFAKLKSLGVGEYVFVYNAGYRYTYKVVSNGLVQPNDTSVMKHEEKSFLTLITCDSYDEATGTYLRRVVVRAQLVDVREVK